MKRGTRFWEKNIRLHFSENDAIFGSKMVKTGIYPVQQHIPETKISAGLPIFGKIRYFSERLLSTNK